MCNTLVPPFLLLRFHTKSHQLGANQPLKHDVHFWLGENTSQDEAGTAAYKTVELDDRLGRAAVQHREVQGHESSLFLQYFPEYAIENIQGGIDSGFNHVEAATYQPRLLHVKGTNNNLRVVQVPLSRDSLNSGDCFILDLGLVIIQWNGASCSLFEKMRGKPEAYIVDENDHDPQLDKFWSVLGGKGPVKSAIQGGSDRGAASELQDIVKLYRSFKYAQKYLSDFSRPSYLPVSCVVEGGESAVFDLNFGGGMLTRDIDFNACGGRDSPDNCNTMKMNITFVSFLGPTYSWSCQG